MRKLLLALMAAIFAIFLTACGGDDEAAEYEEAPPVETPEPQPEPDTYEPEAGFVFVHVELGLGEAARHMTRAEILANIPDVTPQGRLVLGSVTGDASANILGGWDNNIVNAHVRELIGGHFLSTSASNMNREWFPNPMVTRHVDIRDNADGSRTYTFTIYTDNRFSDGRFITAADYAGHIALFTHQFWANLAYFTDIGFEIAGRNEWLAGEAGTLRGVRLYDNETFSVTIDAAFLPFIWESTVYMNWIPAPMHVLTPNAVVADNGDGVFLAGLTQEDLAQSIMGTNGFRFTHPVGAGPYTFEAFDHSTNQITLRANPYFAGTWDGFVPRIETIIFAQRDESALIDSIVRGEIDMLSGQGGGNILYAAFRQLVGRSHNAIDYPRHGFDLLRFHVDHGPTQFASVRQAIKWMTDREELTLQSTGSHGAVVQGPYALSMWWYPLAVERGLYARIAHYSFNPEMAVQILEADGWVLNAQGQPFVPGTDPVRYKDVTGMELLWFGSENTTDPSIFSVDDRDLMRLEIKWAACASDRTTPLINTLVAPWLQAIGILLTPTLLDDTLPLMSRIGGSEPEFHMFNISHNFGLIYSPWVQANPDPAFLGGHNSTFNRDYQLFELANRLRFMELNSETARAEFVDAWLDMIAAETYAVREIPLYTDIFYCFIPFRLQGWQMNSIWSFSEAVVRAYVTE